MNKRIQELAEQAKGFVDLNQHVGGGKGCMVYTYDGLEKFAELLIQECVMLMNKEQEYYSKPGAYEPSEYYERCRAKNEAFDEAARIIKNHFGVKE